MLNPQHCLLKLYLLVGYNEVSALFIHCIVLSNIVASFLPYIFCFAFILHCLSCYFLIVCTHNYPEKGQLFYIHLIHEMYTHNCPLCFLASFEMCPIVIQAHGTQFSCCCTTIMSWMLNFSLFIINIGNLSQCLFVLCM